MKYNEKDIIRAAMKARDKTQENLAVLVEGEGATQSVVGNSLTRKSSMRVDRWAKFIEALNYEVVVRDPETMQEWVLDVSAPTVLGRVRKGAGDEE